MKSAIRHFGIDFLCLALVWIPVLLFDQLGQPYKRGFFCDDESLRHPFHESTVSNVVLYAVGVALPVLSMVAVEISRRRLCCSSPNGRVDSQFRRSVSMGNVRIHGIVVELLHLVAVFLFGAGCSQLTTDIAKYSIGRLRPHFIDACKPNVLSECKPGIYYEDFICEGTGSYKLKDARLSFPSGHASFSAYTMVYLALYLQGRMTWSGSYLLRPLLQITVLMLTWYTGLSRVSDYKHHWSDVLAGFLIGTIAASLTAKYVSNLFGKRRLDNEQLPLNSNDVRLKPCQGDCIENSP